MFNTQVIKLTANIGNAINESNLPPVVVQLVLKDMLGQINTQVNRVVEIENQTKEKGESEDAIQESKLEA